MATVKIFELVIDGVRRSIRNQDELNAALKETKAIANSSDFGTKKFERLQKTQARLKVEQRNVREESKKLQRDLQISDAPEGSYRKLSLQLAQLRRRYKELSEAERNADIGRATLSSIQGLDQELKKIDASMGQYQRNVGNYSSALSGVAGVLNPTALLLVGINALGQGLSVVSQETKEAVRNFNDLRLSVDQLVQGTDAELNNYTSNILAISKRFQVSQDEVLQSANALTDQLTGDFSESLSLIEKGFLSGANQSDEFLDILKEYPQQFRDAGFSGEQFISTITQGVREGIFSDKQADVIKEFGLRVRELTPAAQEALEQINITSSQVANTIEEEGVVGVFQLVQDKLRELPADSQKVGQVLADVFGAPGEDVGVGFINSLNLSQDALEQLEAEYTELQQAQARQLEADKALASSQGELATRLQGSSNQFELIKTRAQTFITDGLVSIVDFFRNRFFPAFDPFVPIFQEVGRQFGLLFNEFNRLINTGNGLSNTITVIANVVSLAVKQVGFLVQGFRAVVLAATVVQQTINGLRSVVQETFSIISESIDAFVSGFNQIRDGNIVDGLKQIGSAIVRTNPISLAFSEGERLGDAFTRGYEQNKQVEAIEQQGKANSDAADNTYSDLEEQAQQAGEAVTDSFNDGLSGGQGAASGLSKTTNTVKSELQSLEETAKNLKSEILSANNQNKDYTEQLQELTRVVGRINEIKDFNAEIERQAKAANIAQDSIAFLRGEVSRLKQELEQAPQTDVQQYIDELARAEEALNDAQSRIDRLQNDNGSFAALDGGQRLEDIRLTSLAEAEGDAERAAERIQYIERELLLKLQSNRLSTEQRKALELEADRQILESRILLAENGSLEELRLKQQLADKEVEINAQKNAQIAEQDQGRLDQLRDYLEVASTVVSGLGEIERLNTDRQLNDVEARYQREIELAEGNTERQAELEAQLSEERARIERESFERQKRARVAEATIAYAQGLINAASQTGGNPILTGIFQGILTAVYLAQLANILSAEYTGALGMDLSKLSVNVPKLRGEGLRMQPLQLGLQSGRLHADGGNHIMTPKGLLEYERDEWFDVDEYGNGLLLSRAATRKNKPSLNAMLGKQFAGKRSILSAMNTQSGGVAFANNGIEIPNLAGAASSFVSSTSTVATLSNRQIQLLADVIASRTAEGVRQGSENGIIQAERANQVERRREADLNNRLGTN